MLGVDEGRDAAPFLGLGDDVLRQRRLAGGLGAEDLDDAPARDAADAQREVEGEGTVGMAPTFILAAASPSLMMEPCPKDFSMVASVDSSAFALSLSNIVLLTPSPLTPWLRCATGPPRQHTGALIIASMHTLVNAYLTARRLRPRCESAPASSPRRKEEYATGSLSETNIDGQDDRMDASRPLLSPRGGAERRAGDEDPPQPRQHRPQVRRQIATELPVLSA